MKKEFQYLKEDCFEKDLLEKNIRNVQTEVNNISESSCNFSIPNQLFADKIRLNYLEERKNVFIEIYDNI